jgi:hypothetical protein
MKTEYDPVIDEMRRIHAQPVKSSFEQEIDREVSDFVLRVDLYETPFSTTPRWKTDKEMYTAFWNERLN